jgi:hypothetical protein
MALLGFELRLRCYNILHRNLLNHIIRSIYEINSYTIRETNPLILFLGTMVLFPRNRVEHMRTDWAEHRELNFQASATQSYHCAVKD